MPCLHHLSTFFLNSFNTSVIVVVGFGDCCESAGALLFLRLLRQKIAPGCTGPPLATPLNTICKQITVYIRTTPFCLVPETMTYDPEVLVCELRDIIVHCFMGGGEWEWQGHGIPQYIHVST